MSMLCNNYRVCWVIFHFIKLLHSKHLSSFLQNFSMRCFRCGKKKTPYKSPLPGASITILPLSQLRLVSFYSVLIFVFFVFLLSCSALANCSIPGVIFLLSTREQKCVSTLNSVKNVAIQILGRGPN